jgi:hypothetical protein
VACYRADDRSARQEHAGHAGPRAGVAQRPAAAARPHSALRRARHVHQAGAAGGRRGRRPGGRDCRRCRCVTPPRSGGSFAPFDSTLLRSVPLSDGGACGAQRTGQLSSVSAYAREPIRTTHHPKTSCPGCLQGSQRGT